MQWLPMKPEPPVTRTVLNPPSWERLALFLTARERSGGIFPPSPRSCPGNDTRG